VEEYVKTFDLETEIRRDDVTDNLLFIDQIIVPLLPRTATVVDVGCGIGRYARFLRRPLALTRDWRYIGVERSEEIVRYSRLLCPDCEFKHSAGNTTIPCPDRSVDLVMASSMLQYTCEGWLDSLREMKRVAKSYIFLSRLPVLRRSATGNSNQTVRVEGAKNHHRFRLFNRKELEDALAELGCRVAARDYGSEIISVQRVSEPVVMNQYLIAKQDPH